MAPGHKEDRWWWPPASWKDLRALTSCFPRWTLYDPPQEAPQESPEERRVSYSVQSRNVSRIGKYGFPKYLTEIQHTNSQTDQINKK